MKRNLFIICLISITLFFINSCTDSKIVAPLDSQNQILIERMKVAADSIIRYTNIPGLVALVVDKKMGIDWVYEAGVSNIPQSLPMNSSHKFRIGSNTKTFVITVLLQLVDEKKVSLDDKLSRYFSEYRKSDSITIDMLANMKSGIFNYTDDEAFWQVMESNPNKIWTPGELVNWGYSFNFDFEPGTDWKYSNTNTIIIGQIIEKVTGNKLEDEIKNRIVNRLQLQNTGLLTSGLSFPEPHPRGYYSGIFEAGFDATELVDISWAWAAGSAYSTPRELQKYAEALVGGGLISDSLQNKRLSDLEFIFERNYYGLGILKRGSFYGHNGALMGYTSSMYHSNLRESTIIIYFNAMLQQHPDLLFFKFVEILYGKDF